MLDQLDNQMIASCLQGAPFLWNLLLVVGANISYGGQHNVVQQHHFLPLPSKENPL